MYLVIISGKFLLGMVWLLLGSQKGGRHHSVVGGVLEFSHRCLVSVHFIGPSLLEMKFFPETFSLSCICLYQLYNKIHLKILTLRNILWAPKQSGFNWTVQYTSNHESLVVFWLIHVHKTYEYLYLKIYFYLTPFLYVYTCVHCSNAVEPVYSGHPSAKKQLALLERSGSWNNLLERSCR